MAKRQESQFINMRNFHSNVKGNLINYAVNEIKTNTNFQKIYLFDPAVGRMGDYNNWNRSEIFRVYGIDPDKNSISEAKMRLKNFKNKKNSKTNVDLYVGKITDDILDIPGNFESRYHIVSCQFAIHYFFEKQQMLENAIRRVSLSLKPGGYFIGTTINGDKLYKLLENNPKIENEYYTIEKQYEEYKPFESKYKFILHDKQNTGIYFKNVSTEFLVSKNVLVQVCKYFGLELKELKDFEDWGKTSKYNLSEKEKEVSYLYFSFIFQKP